MNGGDQQKGLSSLQQQRVESLLELYADNYCTCQNDFCKKHLNQKMKDSLKPDESVKDKAKQGAPISSRLIRDVI